jgi:addiction module HigA family antidote
MRIPTNQPPIHPGEILLEEFIKPYGITPTELSKKIGISYEQINAVINGKKGMNTEMALCLSQLFGTSPELWLNGQMKWDIWHLLHGNSVNHLKNIKPLVTPTSLTPTYMQAMVRGTHPTLATLA